MRIAAGTLAPAPGPSFFAAVGLAARTEGAAEVLARAVEPRFGAPFDVDADGATDTDRVGVTGACVVGCGVEERLGVEDGVLDGAAWPDPTTTVPVIVVTWMVHRNAYVPVSEKVTLVVVG